MGGWIAGWLNRNIKIIEKKKWMDGWTDKHAGSSCRWVNGQRNRIEQNRTAPEKCTHLYDDTQGTIKHTSVFDRVFVGCKARS